MLAALIPLAEGGGFLEQGSFLPFLIMIGVLFYFLLLRPMRKQEQERQSLLSNLKKNDDVLTIGGIYGTVVAVSDKDDEVTVKVADNVRLRMTKSSIARNLTNEEAAKTAKTQGGGSAGSSAAPSTPGSTSIKKA
jgi:preprotein translocase subunit YajC